MKPTGRLGRAAVRACPPAILVGAGTMLFGAFDVMRRGTNPAMAGVICLGLAAVVFGTYFILSLAGYRASSDGSVRAPWPYAWLVVLAFVLAVGAVAYVVLRSLPEAWR
jgi:hypothetical protein